MQIATDKKRRTHVYARYRVVCGAAATSPRWGTHDEVTCERCRESEEWVAAATPPPPSFLNRHAYLGCFAITLGIPLVLAVGWLAIFLVANIFVDPGDSCPVAEKCGMVNGGSPSAYETCYCPE